MSLNQQGDVEGLRQQVAELQQEVSNKQQESEAFANGELILQGCCRALTEVSYSYAAANSNIHS